MNLSVDIWLRGDNHATTIVTPVRGRASRAPGPTVTWPRCWTACCARSSAPRIPAADPDRPVALRGFSWIVNPFEAGGVVIALELSLGAVVAGPFDIAERDLTAMIQR